MGFLDTGRHAGKFMLAAVLLMLGYFAYLESTVDAGTSNRRDVVGVVATAQDLDTTRTHAVDASQWDQVDCQIVWSVASHTDATMTISATVDGSNYETISGTAYTLGAAAGSHIWSVSVKALAGLKFSYAHGSNTTGTYALTCRKEVPTGSEN